MGWILIALINSIPFSILVNDKAECLATMLMQVAYSNGKHEQYFGVCMKSFEI